MPSEHRVYGGYRGVEIVKNGPGLLVFFSLLLIAIQIAAAGTIEENFVPPNVCRNPTDIFVGFEDGTDFGIITNQYAGIMFSTPDGVNWIYGDITKGGWNYPVYYCDGDFWAALDDWSGVNTRARIEFTEGTASYVSILSATYTGVMLEAYSKDGTLLDSTGMCGDNTNTGKMTRLTVSSGAGDIAYVEIHDSRGYWIVDDLCTDAPVSSEPEQPVPEFPYIILPIVAIAGMLTVILLMKRKTL